MRTPAELCSGSEHIGPLHIWYFGCLQRSAGCCAGCGRLRDRRCGRMPLMDQWWVRAPIRTHQRILPRWCLGARPKLHVSRVYLAGIT